MDHLDLIQFYFDLGLRYVDSAVLSLRYFKPTLQDNRRFLHKNLMTIVGAFHKCFPCHRLQLPAV